MTDLPPEAVSDGGDIVAAMFPGLGPETGRKIARAVLEAAQSRIAAAAVEHADTDTGLAAILADVWACTRVWEAWQFGTMTEDDFVPAAETDIAGDLIVWRDAAVAAERERLYAELGNDHYVIFTEDRWTIEHSVECRLSGHMHKCAYHEAIRGMVTAGYGPEAEGRWRITAISSGGYPPILERATSGGDPA